MSSDQCKQKKQKALIDVVILDKREMKLLTTLYLVESARRFNDEDNIIINQLKEDGLLGTDQEIDEFRNIKVLARVIATLEGHEIMQRSDVAEAHRLWRVKEMQSERRDP